MQVINRISRIVGAVVLVAFVVSAAQASGNAAPRDGLFGISRDSASALYAIDLTNSAVQQNGTIDGLLQLSALAKQPTTGVVYGFGTDGTTVSMVAIDPRYQPADGTVGEKYQVTVSSSAGPSAPGTLVDVLGADFRADGKLYGALEFSNASTGELETWLATIGTPQPGDTQVQATLLFKFEAQFIKGIAFDPTADPIMYPDGALWAVSPNFGTTPNTLFKYDLSSASASAPTTVTLATTPAGGFGSLQFTCDGTLYGGTREKDYVEIDAKSDTNKLSGFAIVYEDVDGNGMLNLDVDRIVRFSGLDELVGSKRHFYQVAGAPDLPGVSQLSGDYQGDYWWFYGNGRTNPDRFKKATWTYTVKMVPSGTGGGDVYKIDTSDGSIQPSITGVTGGASLSGLAGVTSCNATNLENAPTPTGTGVTFSLQSIQEQLGNVVVSGSTSVDFCVVGPDPRELGGHYNPGYLDISELPVVEGDANCNLLSQVHLTIAPWYRGFEGTVKQKDGVYFVIELSRYGSVQTDGPTVLQPFPQALIDYSGNKADQNPTLKAACEGSDLAYHPLTLGGTVAADPFDDFPNVEGTAMIAETAQCEGPGSMTRRTIHIWPIRLDGQQANGETINMQTQSNGIKKTVQEAYQCADTNTASTLDAIQQKSNEADNDWTQGRYKDAVLAYEDVARLAQDDPDHWAGCDDSNGGYRNYKGNFMARGLTAAFTVYDRFLLPSSGTAWSEYKIPADLDVPLLDTRPAGTDP